jgi:hypothetical protein
MLPEREYPRPGLYIWMIPSIMGAAGGMSGGKKPKLPPPPKDKDAAQAAAEAHQNRQAAAGAGYRGTLLSQWRGQGLSSQTGVAGS